MQLQHQIFATFIVLLSFGLKSFAGEVFVTPLQSNCGGSCSGDITQPYANFFQALIRASISEPSTIILLYSDQTEHFATLTAEAYNQGNTYEFSIPLIIQYEELEIKPLFCDEERVLNDNSLADKCISRDQKVKVNLKSIDVHLVIRKKLSIQNIIFDGIEAIFDYRESLPSQFSDCLSLRDHCCLTKDFPNSLSSLQCNPQGSKGIAFSSVSYTSFINPYGTTVENTQIQFDFTNMELRNFWGRKLVNFIETDYKNDYVIVFDSCNFDDVFFDQGLIGHRGQKLSSDGYYDPNNHNRTIIFKNSKILNYNNWNRTSQTGEGYLFFADYFDGNIQIKDSFFQDISGISRLVCNAMGDPLFSTTFKFHNLFKSSPRYKSDIWDNYKFENRFDPDPTHRYDSPQISSLLFIYKMYGNLNVEGSTFNRVTGVAGSIISVQDCQEKYATLFVFRNNKFDNNFALDGFTNILIRSQTFREINSCPIVKIENSSFSNSYGCPGAFGNVGIICNWPFIILHEITNYDPLIYLDISNMNPQVQIMNSTFENNLLSVSNSVAILGSYYASLIGNTFKNNGGTTAEIIKYSLEGSYYLKRFPYQPKLYEYTHFGQTSAVFIEASVRIEIVDNIFQGNWSPFEGSEALAASLTIKKWIPMKNNTLKLKQNSFLDHWGIPPGIAKVLSNEGLRLNSYTPPIITISYDEDAVKYIQTSRSQLQLSPNRTAAILFEETKFNNNSMSFDVVKGCTYNAEQLTDICAKLATENKFLTGIIKFLIPSEANDNGSPDVRYQGTTPELGISITSSEISGNKISTQGCLFSTLWIRSFFLQDLLIKDNQVNPSKKYLEESASSNQPSIKTIIQNRDGLFCQFQTESQVTRDEIQIMASGLKVENNIGTIFNLFPSESNHLLLKNSIFLNNECPYGSTVQLPQASSLLSLNNIFIRNSNPLGLFLIASSSSYDGLFNSYLQNTGRHVSLVYVSDKSKGFEFGTKVYWNSVNPTYKLFVDQMTPQGGLYFLISSQLILEGSIFSQNQAYGGIFISLKGTITLQSNNITDHNISGLSLLGYFLYSTTLKMTRTKITNNSLLRNSSITSDPPVVILLSISNLEVDDLEVSQTPNQNIGAFMFGINLIASFKNTVFEKFNLAEANNIMTLKSSKVTFENLNCNDVISLFKLDSTILTIKGASIKGLKSSTIQLLANMIDSVLDIQSLKYIGGSDAGSFLSLFSGDNNNITIIDSYFLDAVIGRNKIFEVGTSFSLLILRTVFEYTQQNISTSIFDLKSTQIALIEDCTFVLPGQVIQAENNLSPFYFISNKIITNSHVETIKITGSATGYFIDNQFLRQKNGINITSAESQIHLLNVAAQNKFQNNIFISLYGLKGVLEIQGLTKPYNITSSKNIFIDNSGCLGGAVHLDSSLSSTSSSSNLSTADFQNSVFVLNKALYLQEILGKGGAIYQTTSTRKKQITILKNNLFIKNSADTRGGAIFFDYIPPEIDQLSIFKNNYARRRTNNLGSYPVKLVYYGEGQPPEVEPYLSTQVSFRSMADDTNSSLKWENIPSGLFVNKNFTFALLDMYGQIVYDDDSSFLELYPQGLTEEEKYSFSTKLSIQATDGLYIFNNFRFAYEIGGSISITFKSTAIPNEVQIPLAVPITPKNSLNIQVNFRECGIGESIFGEGTFSICMECQPGFWQTNPRPNMASCEACDEISTLCLGGNNVGPKKGYWRLSQTANIVLECPRSSSCLGNQAIQGDNQVLNPQGDCEYGYQGNLCSNCIPGWARAEKGVCTNCNTDAWYYIRVVLTLLFQIAMIVQGVRGTMVMAKNYEGDQSKNMNSGILIRIITNYLQLIALVSGIPITWPGSFKNVFNTGSEISSVTENVFTIDCIFKSGNPLGISVTFFKLLLGTVGGFIFCAFGIIFWIIYYLIKRQPIIKNKDFISSIVTTVIVILYMMQPSAIISAFSFFQCSNLYRKDNSIYFLKKDYDVQCWQGNHLVWALAFALPFLLIWSIVLPLTFYVLLKKNRTKLNSIEISQKYSFLYGGYAPSKYYWELVIMARKFLLIGVNVLTSFHSTNLEVYIFIFLVIFAYVVHTLSRPFSDSRLNALEKLSLISIGIVNFCGLYFQLVSTTSGLDIFVIICSLVGNLIFLLPFIYLYAIVQIEKLKENPKAYSLLIRIKDKCCCCLKHKKIQKLKNSLEIFYKSANKKMSGKVTPYPPDESPIPVLPNIIRAISIEERNEDLDAGEKILNSEDSNVENIIVDKKMSRKVKLNPLEKPPILMLTKAAKRNKDLDAKNAIFNSSDDTNRENIAVNKKMNRRVAPYPLDKSPIPMLPIAIRAFSIEERDEDLDDEEKKLNSEDISRENIAVDKKMSRKITLNSLGKLPNPMLPKVQEQSKGKRKLSLGQKNEDLDAKEKILNSNDVSREDMQDTFVNPVKSSVI